MRTLIRARTRDANALRRARDQALDHLVEVARFRGVYYSAIREGADLVVRQRTSGTDTGEITADEATNGVNTSGPTGATRTQERQATGDTRQYRDARKAYDAQTGLIAKMNQRARDFWSNGGKR